MAVLHVIEGEQEELRQTSKPIESITDEVFELAQNLLETLRAYHVASLSAPQCGYYLRIFVTDVFGRQKVWINPEVIEFEGQGGSVESCASFPELNLEVMRPTKLVVRSLELNGMITTRTLSGIEARLVAHEMDHLDGVIFHDRLDAEELFEQMLNGVETGQTDAESDDSEETDEIEDTYDHVNNSDDAEDEGEEAVEDDLNQILDLLADGVWKITLAVELLKDFELDQPESDELSHLEELGEQVSQSVSFFESAFGDDI